MRSASPNFQSLSKAVSRRRAELGLTYEQVAAASGLSRITVINLELAKTRGSLATWFALAGALEVPIGKLVRHLDDPVDE